MGKEVKTNAVRILERNTRLFRLPMKAGSHPSSTPRIMELQ